MRSRAVPDAPLPALRRASQGAEAGIADSTANRQTQNRPPDHCRRIPPAAPSPPGLDGQRPTAPGMAVTLRSRKREFQYEVQNPANLFN
jgi:hypothetical protein